MDICKVERRCCRQLNEIYPLVLAKRKKRFSQLCIFFPRRDLAI